VLTGQRYGEKWCSYLSTIYPPVASRISYQPHNPPHEIYDVALSFQAKSISKSARHFSFPVII
jgi:hypothetical protein